MDTVALKDQTKSCKNWSSNWTKGTNIKSNNLYHVIYMPSCSPLSSFEEKNFVHVFAFDLVLCYFFRATVHTQVFRLTREFLHKRSTRCVLCICRSENKIFLWVLLCSCFQNIMNIIAVVEKKNVARNNVSHLSPHMPSRPPVPFGLGSNILFSSHSVGSPSNLLLGRDEWLGRYCITLPFSCVSVRFWLPRSLSMSGAVCSQTGKET